MSDFILLLVGKSGSGKSTVAEALHNAYEWRILQSYTTRPKRYANESGHIFINKEEFDRLENLCAYTIFDGYEYCATQEQVDNAEIYIIDPTGVEYFKKLYKGDKMVIPIYLDASDKILWERMRKRGDSIINTMRRILHDRKAFKGFEQGAGVRIHAEDDVPIIVANIYKAIIMCTSLRRKMQEVNHNNE